MKNSFLLKSITLLFISITIGGCTKNQQEDVLQGKETKSNLNVRMEGGFDLSKLSSIEISYLGQLVTVKETKDSYIFEGDILLDKADVVSANRIAQTKGAAVHNRRWPNNRVFYRINPGLTNVQRVNDAIAHIQSNSNLTFELNNTAPNYIEIVPGAGGTYSDWIGYKGGRQEIGLADWATVGNTIHEFNHALGIFHEQTRADRDNSIIVNFNHIPNDQQTIYQYKKYSENGFSGFDHGPFDFGSIMLYSSDFFNGGWSMTDLNGNPFFGQRNGLSVTDISLLDFLYPGLHTIIGDAVFCNKAVYQIVNLHPNATVTWSVTNGTLTVNGNTVEVTKQSDGNVVLTATVTRNGIQSIVNKTIYAGLPSNAGTLVGTIEPYLGKINVQIDEYFADNSQVSFKWYVNGVYKKTSNIPSTGISVPGGACGQSYLIQCEAVTACGTAAIQNSLSLTADCE